MANDPSFERRAQTQSLEKQERGGEKRKEEKGEKKDLRKTARGASSPAKPALHIPELEENCQ